ncbi:hypothetical protein SAMN05192534_11349 [Alteribacillus persepolensis]|uniref:Uncharacterized protein n=1 Tax=Alteribacillus persepolensis TaxID=568899 RepID=A0A1G8FW06_9BACI|nr:hypothetical protein [Alteribacillus persepolensis]SDH86338.1 hypothetical protein SAMN05192534_11349 [Alteribacillus persepolensis]
MEDIWQIGSFIIHKEWVAAGVSLLLAFGVLRYIGCFAKDDHRKKDVIGNMLFVFILVYQLSSFLFQTSLAFRYPISVLASPGTWKEWTAGWIAAGIYLAVASRSEKKLYFEAALYSVLIYILTEFFFLSYQIYSQTASAALVMHMTAAGLVFLAFLFLKNKLSYEYLLYILLFFYGMVMSAYSFIFPAKALFLYMPAWFFVCVASVGTAGFLSAWIRRGKAVDKK